MKETLKNFREEIVTKLCEQIKNGTAPFQKPWRGMNAPQNGLTGRHYHGINHLILAMQGLNIDGGQDPRWLTFKQASDNGMRIRKGSKGTHITLWKPIITQQAESESESDETSETEQKQSGIVQRVFTVFHASQIEGIGEYKPAEITEGIMHEKAESIIANSGAKISYGGGRACYHPAEDYIQLPLREDFSSTEGFYSTALHELVHWTGHESRLNRGMKNFYGSYAYAYEELIAEIGSLFVCSEAGIMQTPGEFQNHASYVDAWLKSINENPNTIFHAASEANKACEYLINAKPLH